jgi:hypothetical protein
LTFHIPERPQSLPESFDQMGGGRTAIGREVPDPRDLHGLLGLGRERRESKADNENDRAPDPLHSHLIDGWLGGSLADLTYWRRAGRADTQGRTM